MARKNQLVLCKTCGEVNPVDAISCKSCLADLSGKGASHVGQSQLAQLHRLVKQVEGTNRRLTLLLGSVWLIFALYVVWTVVAGIMGVGGPAQLFRWPF